MPSLISQKQYDDTIAIIENRYQPSPLFLEMKEWYKERNIILYNLFVQEITDKYSKQFGMHKVWILSDMHEGSIPRDIYSGGLLKFFEIAEKYGLYKGYQWANLTYEKKGLSGYFFPRIWRTKVIEDCGIRICPYIEEAFKSYGVVMCVNSGLGCYTVFFKDEIFKSSVIVEIKKAINNYVYNELKCQDRYNLINQNQPVVYFDTIESLNKLNGNLYYYYK